MSRFGAGFVTGLASSVDNMLKKDIERNQDRLSRAQIYLTERDEQKLAAAELEEKELTSALQELTALTGSKKRARMAADGAGGTLAGIQKVVTDIRTNQEEMGDTFKLSEFLDYTGEDQLTDVVTLNSMLKRYGPSLKPTSVSSKFREPTGMMKALGFNLGADKLSSDVSIPDRFTGESVALEGPKATINYTNTAKALRYAKEMDNKYTSFDQGFTRIQQELDGLDEGTPEYTDATNRLNDLVQLKMRIEREKADATGENGKDKSIFTVANVETMIDKNIARATEPFFKTDISTNIRTAISGTEAQAMLAKLGAFDAIETTYTVEDTIDPLVGQALTYQRGKLKNEIEDYRRLNQSIFRGKVESLMTENSMTQTEAEDAAFKDTNNKVKSAVSFAAMIEASRKNMYIPGDVIRVPIINTETGELSGYKFAIWSGKPNNPNTNIGFF
jgi:hypothetical protein